MHQKVHKTGSESRKDVRIEYDLHIRSFKLGLVGKADVVEFHRQVDETWLPYPVEYKRGKPKQNDSDLVQLCAQAICLEEMLKVKIPEGALFYGQRRRRHIVCFTEELKQKTASVSVELHQLITDGVTPLPLYGKHCESCSLYDLCLPNKLKRKFSVNDYISGFSDCL